MEIRLAKTAGFCFGVDRAVKLTYGLLDEGRKVATLGPLIHNPQTVEDLERRGALVADTPADVPTGYEWSSAATVCPRTYLRRAGRPGLHLSRCHLPLREEDTESRFRGRSRRCDTRGGR